MGSTANWPEVAVVIAFYNGSKWIERALRSVLAQTVPAKEIVVVNDGSRQDEAGSLAAIAERLGVRVINQANSGQGGARNAGVAATKSSWICFLDQDDFFLPRHIEALAEAAPRNDPGFGFVYGDFHSADERGLVFNSNALVHLQPQRHPKVGDIRNLIRDDMFVLPSASMIARAAFEEVGGFDPQFKGYEDDDLFLRIFRAGFSNSFIREAVYVWCQHPNSASYNITMSRSRFAYFKKLAETFPDNPHTGYLFFAQSIEPRFHKWFYRDAVRARMGFSGTVEERGELVGYYLEFADRVCADPRVRPRVKLRARFRARLVGKAPDVLFSAWRFLKNGPRR